MQAAIQPAPQHFLTSTVIQQTEDGYYEFGTRSMLVQFEALRREIARTDLALEHFDPETSPWKALYMHAWLANFLLPVLLLIDENELHILIPFSKELGVEVPAHFKEQDETSINLCSNIIITTEEILRLSSDDQNSSKKAYIPSLVDKLKLLFFNSKIDFCTNTKNARYFGQMWSLPTVVRIMTKYWCK